MPRYLLFLLLFVATPLGAQHYKYLVMKGGGIRGIAYCGALQVLEQHNVTPSIEKVAGTSVGAIVGALFSVGYTAHEIEAIMYDLDIKTFNDGQWFFIGGQKRMRKRYGWYKGRRLEAWLGDRIKEKTGNNHITFRQLHELSLKDKKYKDLYVTATNLTRQRLEIFSAATYPDLPITIAVRASASIPLYYGAVFIDSAGHYAYKPDTSHNYNVFADGGLLANYPITIFNEAGDSGRINAHTLGLKLDRPEQIPYYAANKGLAPYHIASFKNYVGALYNVTIEQLGRSLPYAIESPHTIYISNGNVSPKVRHITLQQKKALYANGMNGAADFFK